MRLHPHPGVQIMGQKCTGYVGLITGAGTSATNQNLEWPAVEIEIEPRPFKYRKEIFSSIHFLSFLPYQLGT